MKKTTYKRKDLTNKISYKLNMNCDESKIILDCVLDSFNELFLSRTEDMRIELRNTMRHDDEMMMIMADLKDHYKL